MEILIKKLNEGAKLPVYSSEAGPGIELYAVDEITLEPGVKTVVATGVAMAMPVGYVGLVWNEESMATNVPVQVISTLVDSGYREEIKVTLINTGTETVSYQKGQCVAQLLVQHIHRPRLIEAEDLSGE